AAPRPAVRSSSPNANSPSADPTGAGPTGSSVAISGALRRPFYFLKGASRAVFRITLVAFHDCFREKPIETAAALYWANGRNRVEFDQPQASRAAVPAAIPALGQAVAALR